MKASTPAASTWGSWSPGKPLCCVWSRTNLKVSNTWVKRAEGPRVSGMSLGGSRHAQWKEASFLGAGLGLGQS